MKTVACPKCSKSMHKDLNKRKDKTWKCYSCKHICTKPNVREKVRLNVGKKRVIQDRDILKRPQVLNDLNKASADPYKLKQTDVRDFALICTLYLTGARISEVVGMPDPDNKNKYIVEPLRKHQIQKTIVYEHKIWRIESMPILKRKFKIAKNMDGKDVLNYPLRNVSALLELERPFIEYIDKWLRLLPEDDSIVFQMTRQHAWRICMKFNKSFNHYWRHCRLTNLAVDYGFTDLQLQHFIGWSNSQMASKYTHLDDSALIKAMITGVKYIQEQKEAS